MNLEELREAMASDATKKAKKQEEEITRLKKELNKKQALLAEKNDMLRTMFNRCYVQMSAGGAMCFFCNLSPTCNKLRSVMKENQQ